MRRQVQVHVLRTQHDVAAFSFTLAISMYISGGAIATAQPATPAALYAG